MATITAPYTLTVGEDYDAVLLNAILGALTIGTIIGSEIASATITGANIASATIESGNIAADAIGASHIASNTISADDIQTDAITATHISAGAVTSAKIYAGAVTADKISVNSLDAISANLGEVTAGTLTAPLIRTSANPAISRVLIDLDGIRGYGTNLGLTFKLPTDGSAPVFASGTIQNATIIDTTIISNDFKSSSELPWLEMTDAGLAYRFAGGGAVYGTGVYGTATYGAGVAGYFGNSAKPVVSIEEELTYADIRLFNRSSAPAGAAQIGDLCVVNGKLMICSVAGTPGTYTVVGAQTA